MLSVSKVRPTSLAGLALAVVISAGCGSEPAAETEAATAAPAPVATASDAAEQRDAWWRSVAELCGKAFGGTLVSEDPIDAIFAAQSMTLHGRHCEADRMEIPFHVGIDRSRTWVLTRAGDAIQLEHDHRHEDGEPDAVTLYGGMSRGDGDRTVQHFPADARSISLFEEEGLEASVENVWSMEIVPGERFSYVLRRPQSPLPGGLRPHCRGRASAPAVGARRGRLSRRAGVPVGQARAIECAGGEGPHTVKRRTRLLPQRFNANEVGRRCQNDPS